MAGWQVPVGVTGSAIPRRLRRAVLDGTGVTLRWGRHPVMLDCRRDQRCSSGSSDSPCGGRAPTSSPMSVDGPCDRPARTRREGRLLDRVAEHGEPDPSTAGLAARQRLGQVHRVVGRDLRRHAAARTGRRWPQRAPVQGSRAPRRSTSPQVAGSSARKACPPHASRERDEVDRRELAAILGIAEEDHLLPLDHPERVVLDDHDLDREALLDAVANSRHEHREAAVADERDDLPVRVGDLGGRSRTAGRSPSTPGCRARRTFGHAGSGSGAPPRL